LQLLTHNFYILPKNCNVIVYIIAYSSEKSVVIYQTNFEFRTILNVIMLSAFYILQKLSKPYM